MTKRTVVVGVLVLLGVSIMVHSFLNKNNSSTAASLQSSSSDTLQNQNSSTDSAQTNLATRPHKTYDHFPGILPPDKLKNKKAVIQTDKGTIEFEIYPEASMAASNFIFLSQDGFYNGLIFHRVKPGFVIQGGDPNGNGTGGPGYEFPDEPVTRQYDKGIVAMANAGPNTNGSQFFIMLADHPDLPPLYTIFGKVTKGMDVVEQIKVGDVMKDVSIQDLNQ